MVAFILCAGCGASAYQASSQSHTSTAIGAQLFPVDKRRPLPEVSGKSLMGKPLSLRSLVGHGVLVINVWAAWCANCREESKAIVGVAAALGPNTARFVGIDEQDVASKARSFAAATGMTYAQLADESGEALRKLTLLPNNGIPSTLLVDQHGMMAARIIGPVNAAELRKLVDQVAEGA
jgi:peroxiredoxin